MKGMTKTNSTAQGGRRSTSRASVTLSVPQGMRSTTPATMGSRWSHSHDHTAPFARPHAGNEGGADQEGAIEIDREHLAPVGKGHLGKFLLREDAGAIDHDVDVAEFDADRLGHVSDRWLRRHVAIDGERLTAGGLHQLHGLFAIDDVNDRDVYALSLIHISEPTR